MQLQRNIDSEGGKYTEATKFSGAKCSVPGDMKGLGKWGIREKDFQNAVH